jgi:iron complex outermembrane receptor protein
VGLPQQGAPRHSASVWAKYAFLVGESTPSFVAVGVRHLGKMRSNTDNGNANLTNPRFALLDLAMGFDCGPWRVSLNINNLLNKQALYDCGYLENLCYRSAERTATVNATYRF